MKNRHTANRLTKNYRLSRSTVETIERIKVKQNLPSNTAAIELAVYEYEISQTNMEANNADLQ